MPNLAIIPDRWPHLKEALRHKREKKMNSFATLATEPLTHGVELYTDRLLIQGSITVPFKRISDMMNLGDYNFITVEDAALGQVGQAAQPRKLGTSLLGARSEVHFAVATSTPTPSTPLSAQLLTDPDLERDRLIQKTPTPCYAITSAFVIHGTCHLVLGITLEKLLELGDTFIPFTDVTIYPAVTPQSSLRHDLVVVNREKLEAIYLA